MCLGKVKRVDAVSIHHFLGCIRFFLEKEILKLIRKYLLTDGKLDYDRYQVNGFTLSLVSTTGRNDHNTNQGSHGLIWKVVFVSRPGITMEFVKSRDATFPFKIGIPIFSHKFRIF